MTSDKDLADLITVAQEAAGPTQLQRGQVYGFCVNDRVHLVNLTGDEYRDTPQRKTGQVVVTDPASFLAYWAKHSKSVSEIYADVQKLNITAVLDAHGIDEAGWGRHRLHLNLRHSAAFTAWQTYNGRMMPQVDFAEFLETNRADIVEPAAAALLEMVQEFFTTTKVTFRSSTRLKSGQRQLTYVEETSGGSSHELTLPDEFTLSLPIFHGATVGDAVTARLRYRINEGKLSLGYVLDRLSDVINTAFEGVVAEIQPGVGVPVLRGTSG